MASADHVVLDNNSFATETFLLFGLICIICMAILSHNALCYRDSNRKLYVIRTDLLNYKQFYPTMHSVTDNLLNYKQFYPTMHSVTDNSVIFV